MIPPGWDATTVLAAAPFISWSGDVWRVHLARYQAADATGSTIASGRFNRAQREYPNSDHWRVLYLSLGPDTPIGEVLRHFSHRPLAELRLYRRTRLSVSLTAVLDCRDVAALGLTVDVLFDDLVYDVGHALGLAAVRHGAEAILVPSTTRAGDNLILFPDNLLPGSRLEVTTDVLEFTHFVAP